MASKTLINAVQSYDQYLMKDGRDRRSMRKRASEEQVMNAYTQACQVAMITEKDLEYGLNLTKRVKNMLNDYAISLGYADIFGLEHIFKGKDEIPSPVKYYYEILSLESHYLFDSYMLFLEKNRPFEEKFYLPRRRCLRKLGVIDGYQKIFDDELDLLCVSMPPGVGKTTLERMFHSWYCGLYTNDYNLFYSHSGDITEKYYKDMLDILTNNEYAWGEIFEGSKVTATNANLQEINIDKHSQFANVQCTSIGAKNAGKVRASKLLLVDDTIGKQEEALNKNYLDKVWDAYSIDARQRKLDGCKEVHNATRWSLHDVIGRLSNTFEDDPRALFIAIPDIDPVTGKSNFDYDVHGFSVKFFNNQAMLMDDISYRCLYKNEPIEREGLLYHPEEMRTYLELPDREPDAILSVCDTKNKGTDFMVMPVCYVYGRDHYCVDAICDDSTDYGLQYENLANMICKHNVQQDEFESNNGGDRVAFEVEKIVHERGCRCNILTKPTETNKETRIIVNADWVKKNVVFKDPSLYTKKEDYGVMMQWLFSYSVAGKKNSNPHDDVPDCFANYALFVERQLGAVAEVTSRFF